MVYDGVSQLWTLVLSWYSILYGHYIVNCGSMNLQGAHQKMQPLLKT